MILPSKSSDTLIAKTSHREIVATVLLAIAFVYISVDSVIDIRYDIPCIHTVQKFEYFYL